MKLFVLCLSILTCALAKICDYSPQGNKVLKCKDVQGLLVQKKRQSDVIEQQSHCPYDKSVGFVVSEPKCISGEWNIFKAQNTTKLVATFSWKPASDSSVKYLQAYQVNIYKQGPSDVVPLLHKELNYCIHKPSPDSVFSIFYGLHDDEQLNPNDQLQVFVTGLPNQNIDKNKDNSLAMEMRVPSCSELACKTQFSDCQLLISIEEYMCDNRTIKVKYNFPVPKSIAGQESLTLGEFLLGSEEEILFSLLFNISDHFEYVQLPKHVDFYKKFYVQLIEPSFEADAIRSYKVWGQFSEDICNPKKVNIIPSKKDLPISGVTLPIIFLPLLVILIVVIALCCHPKIKRITSKYLQKSIGKKHHERTQSTTTNSTLFSIDASKNTTVFIVYTNDHPKHKGVILKFASFLNCDLGFNVILDLWEQEEIFKDSVTWMESSLSKADKVLVIWSAGAKALWDGGYQASYVMEDLFTPVVKRVRSDLLFDKNIDKYFCTYFEYSAAADIPPVFRDMSFCQFELMKQFEELYFRLRSCEAYGPEGILRVERVAFDRYFDPELNNFGPSLECAIAEMCVVVEHDADWHKTSALPDLQETEQVAIGMERVETTSELPDTEAGKETREDFPHPTATTRKGQNVVFVDVNPHPIPTISVDVEPPNAHSTLRRTNLTQANSGSHKREPVEHAGRREPTEHSVELYTSQNPYDSVQPFSVCEPTAPKTICGLPRLDLAYIEIGPSLENPDEQPVVIENRVYKEGVLSQDSGIDMEALSPCSSQNEFEMRQHTPIFSFPEPEPCHTTSAATHKDLILPKLELAPIDLANDPRSSLMTINLKTY